MPPLEERDFLRLAHLAHRYFGLHLGAGSEALVAARLGRLVRELGLQSFAQYCDYLLADRTGTALAVLADRLTTNHTSFFREPEHLDFLCSTALPILGNRPHIDIWSAGCSSGEEPYSIAISTLDCVPQLAQRISIRATDISTRMLDRASIGLYTADRVQSVPSGFRARYFTLEPPGAFRIATSARSLVHFARHNLIDPFPALRFSAIFCRNVMLYFDRPTHQSLVQRFAAHLEPGGFLFIGRSESLNGINHTLEPAGPAVYRKPMRGRETAPLMSAVSSPASRAGSSSTGFSPSEKVSA